MKYLVEYWLDHRKQWTPSVNFYPNPTDTLEEAQKRVGTYSSPGNVYRIMTQEPPTPLTDAEKLAEIKKILGV